MKVRLTHAQRARDVGGVPRFAEAAVGAQGVDALTVLTKVSHHATLIDVCGGRKTKGLSQINTS